MIGTIHERIERLVKEFGGGKNTVFADKIGVSEGNIRGYIKGIMPKYDVLEKIVTSLDVNPDWLLTGRGNMEKNRTSNRPEYKCRKSSLSKPTIWSISSAFPFTIWRRRPDWFPCSTMSMRFRSAIYRCRICLHAMGLFMCAGIRCTHYSKAAILSFTSRYTTCSTGFSGVKCTLYRPMSMGTSS